jgi:putative spermidine/putrescine transport system permease protein
MAFSPKLRLSDKRIYILLLAPLVIFLLIMVIYPILIAVFSSLGLARPVAGLPESFTLVGYRDFFDPDKPSLSALWFTFKVTTYTTVFSTVIGIGLAIFFKLRKFSLPPIFSFLMKIPLFTPYLISAFIFYVLLYPRGYIGILVKKFLVDYVQLFEVAPALVSDPLGIAIIVCGTWMRLPYAFIITQGLLDMVHPSYEEAARNLGARRGTIMWRIYIPLVKYGLFSAAVLNFLALFIAFSIPYVLGSSWPQFLSVFIYVNAKDQGNWLAGYTTAVIYVVLAMFISFLYTRAVARTKYEI